MKKYVITYTNDKRNYDVALVSAMSYTKALLEFAMTYPNAIYTAILEVMSGESVG